MIHFLHYRYIRYKEIGSRNDLHGVHAVVYKFYLIFNLPGTQSLQDQFLMIFLQICLGIAHQDLLSVKAFICSHDPVVVFHRHHHDLTDILIFFVRKFPLICVVQNYLVSFCQSGHHQLPVVKDIFFLDTVFFQSTLYNLVYLAYNPIFQRRRIYHQISGISGAKTVLGSQEQTDSAGHHNQNHSRQNTDGCQAGAVPLHTEHHGRQRYKMVCLIVIFFVLFQYFT